MDTDRLFRLLSATHPLSGEMRAALQRSIRAVSYPKGHYLVQAHTPAYHFFFLERGFAVAFRYKLQKRVVTDFWQPGEIILSPRRFFEQVGGDDMIQLTVDSELLSLSNTAFRKLSEAHAGMNVLAREITVACHSRLEERIVDHYTLGAWERYQRLLRKYDGIEQFVSQEMIASYLGITPQSLSRLKNEHHRSS